MPSAATASLSHSSHTRAPIAIAATKAWISHAHGDGRQYALEEVKGRHHSIFVEPGYKESAEYREFWDKLNTHFLAFISRASSSGLRSAHTL